MLLVWGRVAGSARTAVTRNRLQDEVVRVVDEFGDQVRGDAPAGSHGDPVLLVEVTTSSDRRMSLLRSRPYSGSALRVTMRSSGSSVTIRKTLPATL
jgi:hypothetical protein